MPQTPQQKKEQPEYLVLGRIQRPHGIRGELRMSIMTDFPDRIPQLKTVYLGKSMQAKLRSYTLTHTRFHQGYALLTFEEIPDRNAAELLRGLMVMVDMAHAVPLEEGEFYLYQLIGMQVILEDETVIGPIREVMETGANDVYVVQNSQHGEILLPAHEETIIDIDFEREIITMRLPEGLFPPT